MLTKSRSSRLVRITEADPLGLFMWLSAEKSNTLHSLFQIGNDIIYVFDTH